MRIIVHLGSPVLSRSKLFAEWVRSALDSLVMVNVETFLACPDFPPLYQSGVFYQEEPLRVETFADAVVVLRRGHGDCAHLAAWRAAELQVKGEPATLRIKWMPSLRYPGTRLFHVQVRRASGRVEDPSLLLGMGKE